MTNPRTVDSWDPVSGKSDPRAHTRALPVQVSKLSNCPDVRWMVKNVRALNRTPTPGAGAEPKARSAVRT
jgi:hypothetical protein